MLPLASVLWLFGSTSPCLADEPSSLVHRKRGEIIYSVRRLVNRASAGQPPASVRIEVESTVGWGCICAPLVFTAANGTAETGDPELFVLPVFKAGVLDPGRYHVDSSFVLIGRYTGRVRALPEYRHERGEPLEEGILDAQPAPEFLVDSWCYVDHGARRRSPGEELRKQLADEFNRMKKEGAQPCQEPPPRDVSDKTRKPR
jgi:hypothetical protein